jgi:hypothetical protein
MPFYPREIMKRKPVTVFVVVCNLSVVVIFLKNKTGISKETEWHKCLNLEKRFLSVPNFL